MNQPRAAAGSTRNVLRAVGRSRVVRAAGRVLPAWARGLAAVALVVAVPAASATDVSRGPRQHTEAAPAWPMAVPAEPVPYPYFTPMPGSAPPVVPVPVHVGAPAREPVRAVAPVVSSLAAGGIPSTALDAYKQAAARTNAANPSCGLPWPLLAAIGRVESDHGRFAGAMLRTDGTSTIKILGIPLNGIGTALIRDTDGGRLDRDTIYDRAVGPMQFIPSTWAAYGVDGNGDRIADPNNIFDASLAAAHYLCAAGGNLRTSDGQARAVLAYNHSDSYLRMVLALEAAYAAGVGVVVPVLIEPVPTAVAPVPAVNPAPPPAVTPAQPRKPLPTSTRTVVAAPALPTTSAPATSSAPVTSSAPATPVAPAPTEVSSVASVPDSGAVTTATAVPSVTASASCTVTASASASTSASASASPSDSPTASSESAVAPPVPATASATSATATATSGTASATASPSTGPPDPCAPTTTPTATPTGTSVGTPAPSAASIPVLPIAALVAVLAFVTSMLRRGRPAHR